MTSGDTDGLFDGRLTGSSTTATAAPYVPRGTDCSATSTATSTPGAPTYPDRVNEIRDGPCATTGKHRLAVADEKLGQSHRVVVRRGVGNVHDSEIESLPVRAVPFEFDAVLGSGGGEDVGIDLCPVRKVDEGGTCCIA